MEKMKEILSNSKKTAIIGLIGSIISLQTGFIIYFIIVLTRMYKRKGNIKSAKKIVVILHGMNMLGRVLSFIVLILLDSVNITLVIFSILALILDIIYLLFFFNIFFERSNCIDNKILVISTVIYSIIMLCIGNINYICQLLILPYFYNYYELLKGENKDGK